MKSHGVIPLVLAVWASTALFSTAWAAPPAVAPVSSSDRAAELVKDGLRLRREGKDAAALSLFQQAYSLAPTPRTTAHLGFCEQALARWVDAEKHLEEALAAKADPWIEQNREVVENAVRYVRDFVGKLVIGGSVAGAEVFVDDDKVGTLPLPAALSRSPGQVRIMVRAPSHVEIQRVVTIVGGRVTDVYFKLERVTETKPLPEVVAPEMPTSTSPKIDVTDRAHEPVWYKSPWVWIGTAAVVAAAVTIGILAAGGSEAGSFACQDCAATWVLK